MRIKLGRPMLLRQIASFSDCTLFFSEEDSCQKAIGYLATDTRELMPGDLFVALRSEDNDGHFYWRKPIVSVRLRQSLKKDTEIMHRLYAF